MQRRGNIPAESSIAVAVSSSRYEQCVRSIPDRRLDCIFPDRIQSFRLLLTLHRISSTSLPREPCLKLGNIVRPTHIHHAHVPPLVIVRDLLEIGGQPSRPFLGRRECQV